MKNLYLVMTRLNWNKLVNAVDGANNAAWAGQNFEVYNGSIGGNKAIGTINLGQSVLNLAAVNSKANNIVEGFLGFKPSSAAGGYLNSSLGMVAVMVNVSIYSNDGRELTDARNSLTIADLSTFGTAVASAAVGMTGAVVAATAIGLAGAAAGLAYFIYQSIDGNDQITFDYLVFGYEHTIMSAFVNDLWDVVDQKSYTRLLQENGGAQTLKWLIQALGDENNLKNKDGETVSWHDIDPKNYRNFALDYIYISKEEGGSGIRKEASIEGNTFETLGQSYEFDFIDAAPEVILARMKRLEAAGDSNAVAAYLYALKNLNPIVALNPDSYSLTTDKERLGIDQTVAQLGDDWILMRSWMTLEAKGKAGFDYYGRELSDFGQTSPDNDPANKSKLEAFAKRLQAIREQFGLTADDVVEFYDRDMNWRFKTSIDDDAVTTAKVVFIGKNEISYTGDAAHEWIVGGSGNNTLLGGAGNDWLFGNNGDDILDGGAGADTLNGGAGHDIYRLRRNELSDTHPHNGSRQHDIIIDADGQGQIEMDGTDMGSFRFLRSGKERWSAYNSNGELQWVAQLSGDDLRLTAGSSNHMVLIKDWRTMGGNQLGIVLQDHNHLRPADGSIRLMGDNRPYIIHGDEDADGKKFPDEPEDLAGLYHGNFWYTRNANGDIENHVGKREPGFDDVLLGRRYGNTSLIIDGGYGDDALEGGRGDDLIEGGDGSDLLVGGGGSDVIKGGDGNDFIFANARLAITERRHANEQWEIPEDGREVVFAGSKWGVYTKSTNNNFIYAGINILFNDAPGTEGDYLEGGDGDDHIFGSNRDDVIEGDGVGYDPRSGLISHYNGNDIIHGLGGNDNISGSGGDDWMRGDGSTQQGLVSSVAGVLHGMDYLDGGDGDDYIAGDGNHDVLFGGAGDDTLYGDQIDYDVLFRYGRGYLEARYHGNDYLYGGEGNDNLVGGGGDDHLYGGSGDDHLWGDDGDIVSHAELNGRDFLYGGAGNDYLDGGYGVDYLDGDSGNDRLYGGAGADTLIGGDGHDLLVGDDFRSPFSEHGDDILLGGSGQDQLVGGAGNDTLLGGDDDDQMWGDESIAFAERNPAIGGSDYLDGGAGNDYLDGGAGDDTLIGGQGNDTLFGGRGGDMLYGGEGADFLRGDEFVDTAPEEPEGHHDDVLDGGAGDDHLIGGWGNDRLYGGNGNDRLWGDAGVDVMDAPAHIAGNDILDGGDGDDYLDGGYGNDILYGGNGSDSLHGNHGDDLIYGGEGADYLYGGQGRDYLDGGSGNDYYIYRTGDGITTIDDREGMSFVQVDSLLPLSLDVYENGMVLRNGMAGDAVYLAGYYPGGAAGSLNWHHLVVLQPNGQNVTLHDFLALHGIRRVANATGGVLEGTPFNDHLSGSDLADDIRGGAGEDVLLGKAGNDILNGGAGADYMAGGLGNDVYYVDHIGDVVLEKADEGIDTVYASIDYILGDHVENLTLAGDGHINAYGNALSNIINGNEGDNILQGFEGNDRLSGGAGNDNLYGGQGNDRLMGGEGKDLLYGDEGDDQLHGDAGADKLWGGTGNDKLYGGAQLDELFGGDGDDELYGHSEGDRLYGGNGNDKLDGGLGGDRMVGGAGDDQYWVDNTADVVVEAANEGTDTVHAGVHYSLTAHVENLKLLGAAHINGNGNALANTINSNVGNNTLKGFDGNDKLIGGEGNDKLHGGNGDDTLLGGGGNDFIYGDAGNDALHGDAGDDTLYGHAGNDQLYGGAGNDKLYGGAGDDVLQGHSGNDTLYGGLGKDTLTGGAGADIFAFDTILGGGNVDIITDFGAGDKIGLSSVIFGNINTANSAFFHQGAAAADADDRIIYHKASGKLYYDADGNGSAAAVQFAQLAANADLNSAHFMVL